MRPQPHRSAGFTLIELVIAMTIMTVLMGGMASAILVASHALPDEDDLSQRKAAAVEVVERISRDLALAATIILADQNVVRFTVPDRGHGDACPETIKYTWAGTPGDPLEYRYNGCAAITLCEDVHDFSLTYSFDTIVPQGPPSVLLIVENDSTLSSQDEAKRSLMESWGFAVRALDDGDAWDSFAAAAADVDVVYISERIFGPTFAGKVTNTTLGVVIEEGYLYSGYGIAQGYQSAYDVVGIIDDTHEITSGFAIGVIDICPFDQPLTKTTGDLAPGAQLLASLADSMGLMVIDVNAELLGGDQANGRRVKLPWGGNLFHGFDMATLSSDGETIMRRAIVWAAAPVVYAGVTIEVQTSSDASSRVIRRVQLLNQPEALKP